MTAVDQGKSIEYQHDGGGEPVVLLHHQYDAEHAADSQGNEEVKEHLAHPFVEGETQLVSFGFDVSKEKHRQQGKGEKNHAGYCNALGAYRSVHHREMLQFFGAWEPIFHPDEDRRYQ